MFHHFCQLLSYNLGYTGATEAAAVFKAIQDTSILMVPAPRTCQQGKVFKSDVRFSSKTKKDWGV